MAISRQLSEDAVVARASGLMAAEMDGEIVMMHMDRGNYYNLNSVGSRIWELIEEPMTIKQLLTALLTEYKVKKDRCEATVMVFLDKMIGQGLIAVE
jgi:hypothetical protein